MRVKLKAPFYIKKPNSRCKHEYWYKSPCDCIECIKYLGDEFEVVRVVKGLKEGIDGLMGIQEIKYYEVKLNYQCKIQNVYPEEIKEIIGEL